MYDQINDRDVRGFILQQSESHTSFAADGAGAQQVSVRQFSQGWFNSLHT